MDRHHASDSAAEHAYAAAVGDSGTAAGEASPPGTGSRADDNNVVYQRRRVNPESLALRLGPELVRDLDALILPGNTEMPSFAVRKELQERYNIDRRHVYDYFHSRGLRVVKEDKHGNPVAAGKDAPTAPLPNLRPLRNAPIKSSRPHGSHSLAAERKLFNKPRGITKAKPGRPKKNILAHGNLKVVPSNGMIYETQESNESTETGRAFSEDSPSGPITTSGYVAVNPLLPQVPPVSMVEDDDGYAFNSVANPLDGSFSVKRAIGDIAYAYRHKLVFERMQELAEYPGKPVHTEDRLFSWSETSPCSASGKGLLLPHPKPLTRDERHAIYETLSSSVGPAHGIQECQGTYRKYLEARTKLYFEGLLSGSTYHDSQQPGRSDSVPERKPNEFRHWLSETRFLKRDGGINGSPRVQGSHRNTSVARQDGIDGGFDKPFKQRTVAHWLPTLDQLFPAPEDSRSDGGDPVADSPVLHTRQVTGAREVLSQFRAGDVLPFSAISISPGSPKFAVTSASVGPAAYSQIHGLSGFPLAGPFQPHSTGTSTEVVHLEPRWPEHVPSIAHTLEHPPTPRRGRNISSNNVRSRVPSGSPRKRQIRDLDRIWTRPATTRDVRRRTPSAAGDSSDHDSGDFAAAYERYSRIRHHTLKREKKKDLALLAP